jgi:uncharacterized protein YegL
MEEPRGTVLPVYFVADESWSMKDDVSDLNRGLKSLLDALQEESMAAAKVRFCVVGFSDDARCYLEPADLRDLEDMPNLTANGSTSYAAAFRALHDRIPQDIIRMRSEGYLVNRPAVFFLTDGAPNPGDGWEAPHADLTSEAFGPHPNILAFGIGQADPRVVKQVATADKYAFITASGVDTGRAIAEFIKSLTQSVISSGQALAGGKSSLLIEEPEGFISLDVDTDFPV